MNDGPLGVAVVGAAPDHWSAMAHIPAINALDDVRLRWVVTSNPDSATQAARRWGVAASHDLAPALDDDTVDIVAVTVRVPRHAEIVEAAISAGKHVYCEWPLAPDVGRAEKLKALADAAPGRVHITGLQGRFSPSLRTAARMLAGGEIGRPLTASLRLYLPHGLTPRPAHRAHLRHTETGANVLTIQAGHTLDMLGTVLGRPRVNFARLWSGVPEFVVDTGERLPRDAPDNLVTVLDYDGVTAVAQFSQTGPTESFGLEILGTEGSLCLSATTQPQFGDLSLSLTRLGAAPLAVPALASDVAYPSPLPSDHPGHNVASTYAALATAVRTGRDDALLPRFDAAVGLHTLLDAIAAAAVDSRVTRTTY